jgi:hypothetical protein
LPIFERKYLQTNTASQLAQSVSCAITPRANIAFVAEPAPTGGAVAPLAGLVNVDNVVEGDDVSGSLDNLVDRVATLQDNLAIPSHIRVDPQGRGELRKLKVGGSNTNQSCLVEELPTSRQCRSRCPSSSTRQCPTTAAWWLTSAPSCPRRASQGRYLRASILL